MVVVVPWAVVVVVLDVVIEGVVTFKRLFFVLRGVASLLSTLSFTHC